MLNEKCIICGKDTGVAQSTPIQIRKRYIVGSGQLCRECYYKLYQKPKSGSAAKPNEREMQRLLEMSRKE